LKRVHSSTAFEKDVVRLIRRNKDMEKFKPVIRALSEGKN